MPPLGDHWTYALVKWHCRTCLTFQTSGSDPSDKTVRGLKRAATRHAQGAGHKVVLERVQKMEI